MICDDFTYKLQNVLCSITERRHRLIVVTVTSRTRDYDFEAIGFININLSLQMSAKLKDLPSQRRTTLASRYVNDIIKKYSHDQIIVFSNLEVLFLPELQVDALRLFEDMSKDRTIIILWPGTYVDQTLYYAEPWHREYREYNNPDAVVINF